MPRRSEQAEDGEVMEGEAAQHTHGAAAAEEVASELTSALKEMTLFNHMPATARAVRWTRHMFPAIDNISILRAEAQFWREGEVKTAHLLDDPSPMTAVEAGDGHFPGVLPRGGSGRFSSSQQLVAVFNESVFPLTLSRRMRKGYFAGWKRVLT